MLTSKIILKNQNPLKGFGLLANQTIAQPNGLSYIGTAIDLKDLAAFTDFQKKQGVFNFFFEKDLKYDFTDVPSYYRNFNILHKLKHIEEVLLVGTFPRYEASILNVYIRKIFNKFKTQIYSISN
jgi:NADH dehydrogenase/NADH:ubiquinone oxidoreductase subunit G